MNENEGWYLQVKGTEVTNNEDVQIDMNPLVRAEGIQKEVMGSEVLSQ